MIKCTRCGSTDVYFLQDVTEFWVVKDVKASVINGFEDYEIEFVNCVDSQVNESRGFECRSCGNRFSPTEYLKVRAAKCTCGADNPPEETQLPHKTWCPKA